MSETAQLTAVRPALRRAVRAVCEAATPAAVRAAADALDVQGALVLVQLGVTNANEDGGHAFGGSAARLVGYPTLPSPEHSAMMDALLGVPSATWVALLRSPNRRHTIFAAGMLESFRENRATPVVKTALSGNTVFRALLDALLAAEGPTMRSCFAAALEGHLGGGEPAAALQNLLVALQVALSTWPRAVERLAAAPQCDAVLRLVARLHKPLRRRADDDGGSLRGIHSTVTSLLQSLTARERGAMLMWTHLHDTLLT